MSHFQIRCRACGKVLDNTACAFCEHCTNALLVTEYREEQFRVHEDGGIWRFNWLPVHTPGFAQPGPVVFRSAGLASWLGLENLWIAFNGYWPEQGARLKTCTFKEFEAAVVMQNAMENGINGLVVASAGNTARAFSHLSVVSGFPVIIVVPTMCLTEMWYLDSTTMIPTFAVGDGDYSDSIDVARRIAQTLDFPFEGGVKNIAKRDGLGAVLLEAVSVMGWLPDHYFQAVGSGTGAIGVWEMAERFLSDGRYGSRMPVLHLAQNYPFQPMVRAWQERSRTLFPDDLRPELIGEITTRVLSTRYPAYSVTGGVFDALTATNGRMYGITNEEVFAGMDIFRNCEGIDIVPASGVAVAALRQAVNSRGIRPVDSVLLNITGGGEQRLGRERRVYNVEPRIISKKITAGEIERLACDFLKKN